MKKKRTIMAVGLALVASFVGLLACTLREEDEIAHIKLRLAMDGYITVHVPKKYIGPSHLELAREIVQAKEPVNMIPLAFTYPGFKPWKKGAERIGMSEEEKKQEVFLLLQGGSGVKQGKNGLAYSFLGYPLSKECHPERYPNKEHGFYRYKRFLPCKPQKKHFQDLFFYDAPGDSEDDLMVLCPPPERPRQLCRFYVNYDEMGLVNSEFAAPRTFMTNWQQIIADYKRFIVPFYTDEIPRRHKPTPMSAERLHEFKKREGWKP